MERIAMSQEERDWLDGLKGASDGTGRQKFAAEKMGITDRWVRSLLAEVKVRGDAVVVHGLRGRPSNRRIDEDVRAQAMEIIKSPGWHDFKPAFAAESLRRIGSVGHLRSRLAGRTMRAGVAPGADDR